MITSIREGTYKPNPFRRIEIPKSNGNKRGLGIPTVLDRVVQQAISQVLQVIYEPQFSETSYGFRPHRGAHKALLKCGEYIEQGYVFTVDMDLEKFFDNVSHSKLIEVLSRTIKDGCVISLIHRYLNAGVVTSGKYEPTSFGVPQGGPLSPLLSNREKTKVAYMRDIKFLSYAFGRRNGKCEYRIHPDSTKKMKDKIRELTNRSNGWSYDYRKQRLEWFIRGWSNYFSMAGYKRSMKEWYVCLRRRIRMCIWKSWNRVRTRYRNLHNLLPDTNSVRVAAFSRKSCWRMSSHPSLHAAMSDERLLRASYPTFRKFYVDFNKARGYY